MKRNLLLCLSLVLVAIACSKEDDWIPDLSLKSADNSQVIQWKTESRERILLFCGDEVQDVLEGTLSANIRDKMLDGTAIYSIINLKGTLTSQATGETFKVNEQQRVDRRILRIEFKWNIKGDQGSHYIGVAYVQHHDLEIHVERAICPPQKNRTEP